MQDTYAALLAANDDGDPSNGTRHSCAINAAYIQREDGFERFPDLGAAACLPIGSVRE